MTISVVTITFNNCEELVETLESTRGISGIENVVINGGSCERTFQYLQAHPEFKSISESDRGISDAFNKGLKLSTGEAIMFLNSGDRLNDRAYFEKCRQALIDKNVGFCYSGIVFEDSVVGDIEIVPEYKNLGRGMPYPHQTMVVRRAVFEQIGNFDLNYKNTMCYDFACRLHLKNIRGAEIKTISVRQDGSGISAKAECRTISESKAILVRYHLFSGAIKMGFYSRLLRYKIRQGLFDFGLTGLLSTLKRFRRANKI